MVTKNIIVEDDGTDSSVQYCEVESLQNIITQTLSQFKSFNIDFDPTVVLKKHSKTRVSKIAFFPEPHLIYKFFQFCFGYSSIIEVPAISSDMLKEVGTALFQYYDSKITESDVNNSFIENKFGISASNSCIKRLVSKGDDGYINDEAITIFIDVLNFHLGHKEGVRLSSLYVILDSIASNNMILIDQASASKQKFRFPNQSEQFTSYLQHRIQNRFLNKNIKDIFDLTQEQHPSILGCLNIERLHYYIYEYNFASNTVVSYDSIVKDDDSVVEENNYERMWIAKTIGLTRSIMSNNGKGIYCGAQDMISHHYVDENAKEPSSSAFHKSDRLSDFPRQIDEFNCGPISLHYIASKVYQFDRDKCMNFDPDAFRKQLLIFLIGLKFYQQIELKVHNIDIFNEKECNTVEDDMKDLMHFFHVFKQQ